MLEVCGTSFSLGDDVFLTAAHSLRQAVTDEHPCVGYPGARVWEAVGFGYFELHEDYDLGLFKAPVPNAQALPWRKTGLPKLATVQTVGFPHALQRETTGIEILTRAFRGEVVSARRWNGFSARPEVYELSFMCPRSLSGAPLITTEMPPKVVGVINGNVITRMTVYTETESELETGRETIRETTESLHLGLAVCSDQILGIRSKLFEDKSMEEWLAKKGLLVEIT